jgi:hypothetical protein
LFINFSGAPSEQNDKQSWTRKESNDPARLWIFPQ